MANSASFLPRGIIKEKKKRFRMERQCKKLQLWEKARNEGHRGFQLRILKKKWGKGGLQNVCWENGCTLHVMGKEPHAVPWGLKEAAKLIKRTAKDAAVPGAVATAAVMDFSCCRDSTETDLLQ